MASFRSFSRALGLTLGALAVLCASRSPGSDLAEELFKEQRWRECRMECLRILQSGKDNNAVRLLAAKAGIRLGGNLSEELEAIVSATGTEREIQCQAYSELADLYIRAFEPQKAVACLKRCITHTSSGALFASATKRAGDLMKRHPELLTANEELAAIVKTASSVWKKDSENMRPKDTPLLSHPALWVVAFYRSQIGPAIGIRCGLTPSCSQFAIDALMKHGAIGVALAGDRMVREPDVVALKAHPVVINGKIRYADTVEEHDFWIGKDAL